MAYGFLALLDKSAVKVGLHFIQHQPTLARATLADSPALLGMAVGG